jgi:hypothetical protein
VRAAPVRAPRLPVALALLVEMPDAASASGGAAPVASIYSMVDYSEEG